MRISIQVTRKDLERLQELEDVTEIGKSSIVSILIDEVYSGYKCAKMARNADYMPMALTTKRLIKNIKK
jgi:hypothetical protein